MDTYKIKLTFVEPILGATPKDPEIYEAYIASKAALNDEDLAEELATVEKIEEKGWTGFHKKDGVPILYDYIIKGFFKEACGMLRRVKGTKSTKLQAYKKVIDGLIFVTPRQIPLMLPDGGEMGVIERPLRGNRPQGEIVALARSDTCPVGTTLEFEVITLGDEIIQTKNANILLEKLLYEWFDYGKWLGLRQWRNAGYGRFTYEIAEV